MTGADVIVAGGGPAGSIAARDLARGGARVILLDRARHPRVKICAGGIPPHLLAITGALPPGLGECTADTTVFTYRFGDPVTVHSDGPGIIMVMRSTFDHWLLEQARAAGAEVREEGELAGVTEAADGVTVTLADGSTCRAAHLIGADGAHSRVARALGLTPHRFLGVAVNAEVRVRPEDRAAQGTAAAMDVGCIPEGYGWIFPKRDHLSCGIGSARCRLPGARDLLQRFLDSMPTTRARTGAEIRGWPLPYCMERDPLTARRTLLCGDAACLVDPLSGEGIYFAARSGQAAAATLLAGDPLPRYAALIDAEIRDDLAYARKLADIFFAHPYIAYKLGVKNRTVVGYFEELLRGERTYRSVFSELKREFSAPFRALLPKFGGK